MLNIETARTNYYGYSAYIIEGDECTVYPDEMRLGYDIDPEDL